MNRRSGLLLGLALVAAGVAGFAFGGGALAAVGGGGHGPFASMMSGLFGGRNAAGYGMMGGYGGQDYGMMGGYGDRTAMGSVTQAAVTRMGDTVPPGASIDRGRNRIAFRGRTVDLQVVGSPRGQRDETFRIAGLVNPTIVVPQGAEVRVEFVNADPDMLHNFVVSVAQPPFAYTPMMQGAPAFAGAMTPFLAAFTGGSAQSVTTSFVASQAGSYTYLCTVPGHAANGMYGQLIVQ